MTGRRIRAVGFDLGETLIGYGEVPLSWQTMYRDALGEAAEACAAEVSDDELVRAEEILASYNTRLSPRTTEVTSSEVLGAILEAWKLPPAGHLQAFEETFFRFFQRNAEPYPDAMRTLSHLQRSGRQVGALTDVPYGMPTRLVELDIASLAGLVDILLTSVDVGFRKPHPRGYEELVKRLSVDPEECLFVGNEAKDIEGANAAGLISVLIDRGSETASFGERYRVQALAEIPQVVANHEWSA